MTLARWLLGTGAAVLIATALFHGSGGSMVSGWLPDQKGAMLRALWYLPSIDWLVTAVAWLALAVRPSRVGATLALVLVLIPAGAAVLIGTAVGWGFPGVWMLAGAALVGAIGAGLLRSRA